MAEEKWMLQTKRADFDEMAKCHHISPVTARVIRNRDVIGREAVEKYLNGGIKDLYSPHLLKDMDKTVAILREKTRQQKPVRIVGDYDIDGVCSTYLLYKALCQVGAVVDYEIPDRLKDGYGINESIIRAAAEDGIDTILTCDNGIAAVAQIRLAKELGLTVLITDHHDIMKEDGREVLPPADAVVNPKQEDCSYPYPDICGGMVAYKLVQALYEEFHVPMEKWLEMVEFAAIATVGDVMKLQDENRIIVKEGLKRMGQTKSLGLLKLIERNDLDKDDITAYQIGFVIGPCLNAGGRLQTAKLALSLLLCQNEEEADQMALELKELNDRRKDMTKQGTSQAVEQVESLYSEDKVLVVYLPDCHESLAGIIAGRLREHFQKPAFVLTDGEESVKGSGRSIETYHMFEALVNVKELLLKFGGHPMAAGLSLLKEHVDEFRRRLNEQARLTSEDFIRKVWIDVPMPLEYINEPLIQELELLEPFGQGNEKPLFAQKGLHIRSVRVLGKNRNAVKFSLATDQGTPVDALLFGDGDSFMEELGNSRILDVIYYPSVNEYNGNKSLQIVIKNYKISRCV
ncbi:single-stranded-DNA-specific exonuclease RecJ [Lacrimispora indolis]|uniref:single-stranded-DNA-specific exonuclease RecJ n=1 Tax=Lacrimispora indolis TaxID=69825 RepID=UPI00045E5D6B|nr:single-stranded-DNA-specific exonuclease RecJ [Lacrimispora indolis]